MSDDRAEPAPDCRPSPTQRWPDDVEAASVPYHGAAFWALAVVGVLTLPLRAMAYLRRVAARLTTT